MMDQNKVLKKIKEICAKTDRPRPIGIDSLALGLNINEQDLKPFLDILEREGHVAVHITESKSRRMARSGTVEYVAKKNNTFNTGT